MMSLLAVIFICYIGEGLPDSVLGSVWPVIYDEVSMIPQSVSMKPAVGLSL